MIFNSTFLLGIRFLKEVHFLSIGNTYVSRPSYYSLSRLTVVQDHIVVFDSVFKLPHCFRFKDVTFIWKYENPEDPIVKGVDNLVATKWSPQFDLIGKVSTAFCLIDRTRKLELKLKKISLHNEHYIKL